MEASEIFIELQDQYMTAKCFLASAEILDKQGHRKEAEKYYRSAIQTAAPIKDEGKKSWFYFRYAMKLLELGEHEKAKQLLLYLLSLESLKDSQKLDVLKTLSDMAKVSKDEKGLKEYEEHSLKIIDKLLSEAKSPKERLRLLFNKGHDLHDLEKYETALETFERTIKLAESISANDRLPDVWASIAEVPS
ncbi:MAG: tetratricopeptide repeat protein [Nitrospirae bacterium]|nr:tetratricopeptide repeat protein [Nitrospirota bacterium]